MAARAETSPAFGQADLSNCEREQIHLAGSIQPHGALLVVDGPHGIIVQASLNAAGYFGVQGDLLGRRLDAIEGDLARQVGRFRESPGLQAQPIFVRCHVGRHRRAADAMVHRPPSGGLVIEIEPAGPPVDYAAFLEDALQRVLGSLSLRALCDETARLFRELTGYDRVMVYRFDNDGHGEVFSEERRSDLEPFLGNWYPATDIPQIARKLYERNRIRVLVDVGYTPVPVEPRVSPVSGQDLDMSLCSLRSISPLHVQYLKNMGVAATLVASLMVGGRLWGLVSCHHGGPRIVHFETRTACELLAETCATRIAALESFIQGSAELAVRRLEQRMSEAISSDGDWRSALFEGAQTLLQPLSATGAALLFDGQRITTGDVPDSQQLRQLAQWLDRKPRAPVIATDSLGIDEPGFLPLVAVASGLVATPLSSSPGEYLIWFRPERVRTVTWGGNPFKAFVVGDDPADLSPRRSFAQWHQRVERTCEPWTEADITAGRLIGETMRDIILQFRSVGMLIAQDRLDHIRQQVRQSELPVIVAHSSGRILLLNEAMRGLLQADAPQWLDELPPLFAEQADVAQQLQDLLARQVPWRGEIGLRTEAAVVKPLLVRADPVVSSPRRLLGFVLSFTDLTEQKAADAARRRFQERILERRRTLPGGLDSTADLLFQTLLSAVVENAQLAALEITDGLEPARMPDMLDRVRASVSRATRLLEQLILHASRLPPE